MRPVLVVCSAAVVAASSMAAASEWIGIDGGYLSTVGSTTDLAESGTMLEVSWQHFNRGRSGLQLSLGYTEMGLGDEGTAIDATIDSYESLVRQKNQLAQLQGGPGNGWL